MKKLFFSILFSICLLPLNAADYVILDTLDDETVEPGHIVLQTGIWVEDQIDNSTLIHGPRTLLRFPVGPWAELDFKTGLLSIVDSDIFEDETGFGDLEITLKAIPFKFYDFNFGLALITKIPTADEAEGLGTDEADFAVKAIGATYVGDIHLFVNLGASIQADPRANSEQDDFFLWGIGAEYNLSHVSDSSILQDMILLMEFEGSSGPRDNINVSEGRYTDGDVEFRFGIVKKLGWLNVGLSGSVGITDDSPDWSFRSTFSYNWNTPWEFVHPEE